MSIDDIVKETINIIRRHITGDYHILLFGSLAKGSALDTSDVDIAIMGNQKIPWNVMVRILEDKEQWIAVFEYRNLTAHTYDEDSANEVDRSLPGYLEIFKKQEAPLAEKS